VKSSEVPVVEAAGPDTAGQEPVEEIVTVDIPPGGVNVRSGPGLDFELLGQLDEGISVVVIGKNETAGWWQIEYEAGENELAWVASAVVDLGGDSDLVPVVVAPVEPGAPTPPPTATPTPEPIIAGSIQASDAINVRAEPSLEGTIVGGLYLDESADVLAVSENAEWWQIDFPDGPDGAGWVSAEFVRFQGDRLGVPIFGIGTVTPTPGPTEAPTATRVPPTPTAIDFPPTFAPTATSVYKATSAALLNERGTPDPAVTELSSEQRSFFQISDIPWGIVAVVIAIGIFWYQFSRRRNRSRRH
jgi:SH3-like domain-containing protein